MREAIEARGIAVAIDGVAEATMRADQGDSSHTPRAEFVCDACDTTVQGEPAGSGLYLWTRDGGVRVEEPPLCASCATAIGVTALAQWSVEEEEG